MKYEIGQNQERAYETMLEASAIVIDPFFFFFNSFMYRQAK